VKIIHGPWWKKGFQFELDQHSKLGIQNGLWQDWTKSRKWGLLHSGKSSFADR
jgi:hypothetical protein